MTAIKAVFFDWFYTLCHPQPERHELYSQILPEFGVEASLREIIRGIYEAEVQVPGGTPYRWKESAEPDIFIRYQNVLLASLGAELPRNTVLELVRKMNQGIGKVTYVLYEDVLPTLELLKRRGLILGLITTMGEEVADVCRGLGLEPYLDFVVSSKQVGVDKPQPPIFLAALERAGVAAPEAVYVGDQYGTDVVGARGVGIKPILIDRNDLSPEVSDCPRIQSLVGLAQHL